MFRISRPHRPRLAGSITAGVMVATALAFGAPSAQATTPIVDLEITALRISGGPISPGGVVPAGATLTPVHLTTSDPETSVFDGRFLSPGQPAQRFRGTVIPGSPAEEATFRVDGVTMATTVPPFVLANLQTELGLVRTAIFTANGVSYAIPRTFNQAGWVTSTADLVAGVTSTLTATTLPRATAGLTTADFGLRPVGAQVRTGLMFRIAAFTGTTSVGASTVLDADEIRGNTDAASEESPAFSPETEVLATLTVNNGATVVVRGLRFATGEPYGGVRTSWAFDRAALAAAGATIADVTGVVSFAVFPHDLTWDELGFDLVP